MQIIDTHCHYNLEPLYSGRSNDEEANQADSDNLTWQQHWSKAQEHGVVGSIVVGTSFQTSIRAASIANQASNLFATIGIHPSEAYGRLMEKQGLALESFKEELEELEGIITEKTVAVGEIGLDYFWLEDTPHKKSAILLQQELFKLQLMLAEKHHLPVCIHVRDRQQPETKTEGNAYWDTLAILEANSMHETPFILHCVSGPKPYIEAAIGLGGYIGVAGNATYPNAQALREIITAASKDKVLLETDAPYLPPQQFRGTICEPWMIRETGKFVQEQLSLSNEQILENTKNLFRQFNNQSDLV